MNKPSNRIYFILLLVPLFWGGAFGAAKHVITEISPITAATIRFGLAGIILLGLVFLKSAWKWQVIKQKWLGLGGMALTGIFGYNALFFIALEHTSAINGSLIMATTPVFLTLGTVLFFKESWNARIAIGLFLSWFGVFLVIIKGSWHILISLSFNLGDLLFLAALFCWVIHGLIGKVVMKDITPLLTTTVTTIIGSVLLLVLSMTENSWGKVGDMSTQSWREMFFMIIFASVIGFVLWNKGVSHIGPSKTGLYMNLVPINATWIALVLYGERITWQQIVGMLFVIIGVYTVTARQKRKITTNQTKTA